MYSVDFSQIQIKYILNILYLVYLSVIQFKSIWSNPLEMDNAMDYNTPNTVDLVYYNPRVSHTDGEVVDTGLYAFFDFKLIRRPKRFIL